MKSEGVHITLCCQHCHERVPLSREDFTCPHCGKLCEANVDVADSLMHIAERIQAMTPEELAAIVEDPEPVPQVKCVACNGTGSTSTTLLPSKKMKGKTIKAMCRHCLGTGKVNDAD